MTYKDDEIYLLDWASGEIAVLNMSMEVERWLACEECSGAIVDFKLHKESVWALDQQGKKIVRFSKEGKVLASFTVEQELEFPVSLAIGPAGQVYVLDRHAGQIAVFDVSGTFKYRFLSKGQSRGQLYLPSEIVFDPWGRLCVVEEGNGRVEIFAR